MSRLKTCLSIFGSVKSFIIIINHFMSSDGSKYDSIFESDIVEEVKPKQGKKGPNPRKDRNKLQINLKRVKVNKIFKVSSMAK